MANTYYSVDGTLGVKFADVGTVLPSGHVKGQSDRGSDGRAWMVVVANLAKATPGANLLVSALFVATAAASAGVANFIQGPTSVAAGQLFWARAKAVGILS